MVRAQWRTARSRAWSALARRTFMVPIPRARDFDELNDETLSAIDGVDGSLDGSLTAPNVVHYDAGSGSHPPHQWRLQWTTADYMALMTGRT